MNRREILRSGAGAVALVGGASWLMVRARNNAGATQVDKLLFNGAGYHNNIAQKLSLQVVRGRG